MQVTNNAFVRFENLTIENRLLDNTIATYSLLPKDNYLVGVWFNDGGGVVENSVVIRDSDIYKNDVGIQMEGDNVTIENNQIEDNQRGIVSVSGTNLVANLTQSNSDDDALGDACDPDDDNDDSLDEADNCLLVSNSDQVDTDRDTQGNACDPEIDSSDGLPITGLTSSARTPGRYYIPVSGKNPNPIDCTNPSASIQLANLDRTTFTGLCGYQATLESTQNTGLDGMKPLPGGLTFVSGINVIILNKNEPAGQLPSNALLTLSLVIPDEFQGRKFNILFWGRNRRQLGEAAFPGNTGW